MELEDGQRFLTLARTVRTRFGIDLGAQVVDSRLRLVVDRDTGAAAMRGEHAARPQLA